jgi:hypothetical protein
MLLQLIYSLERHISGKVAPRLTTYTTISDTADLHSNTGNQQPHESLILN